MERKQTVGGFLSEERFEPGLHLLPPQISEGLSTLVTNQSLCHSGHFHPLNGENDQINLPYCWKLPILQPSSLQKKVFLIVGWSKHTKTNILFISEFEQSTLEHKGFHISTLLLIQLTADRNGSWYLQNESRMNYWLLYPH